MSDLAAPHQKLLRLQRLLPEVLEGERLLTRAGAPSGSYVSAVLREIQSLLESLFEDEATPVQQPVGEVDEVPPSAWDPDEPSFSIEGVRTLLTDVIRRAAHDWVLYRISSRMEQQALAHDAYVWLFEEDENHPWAAVRKRDGTELMSFLNICQILDVDPDYARDKIRKLTPRDVKMAGRPPERRHRQSLDTTYYVEMPVCVAVPSEVHPHWS